VPSISCPFPGHAWQFDDAHLATNLKKMSSLKDLLAFKNHRILPTLIRGTLLLAKYSRSSRIAHAATCSDFTAEASLSAALSFAASI
jgi:hypothetical protein